MHSNFKQTALIIIILIIAVAAAWFIYSGYSGEQPSEAPQSQGPTEPPSIGEPTYPMPK